MSFRTWMFAVAIGLIAGLLQAQEQAESAQDDPAAQQEATQSLPIPLPVQIIEDDESANARQRREAETDQRDKDDLVAQQGMNAATQAMNEATQSMKRAAWWSVVIVGIGTFLLVWTLCLTRSANKAAQDAVSVTRQIGEAQVRGYLALIDENGIISITPMATG
jgi:hypothetical protein